MSLVIPSLAPGGAERVLALLANEWAGRGHDVTVVTVGPRATDAQPLHPAIVRRTLDLMRGSTNPAQALGHNCARVARLRRELRRARPDAVVSFLPSTNVLTLAATRFLRAGVIVAERIDPRQEPLPPFWAGGRRLFYPHANGIVVQTPEVREWAAGLVGPDRVHVIPNPVVACDEEQSRQALQTPDWLAPGSRTIFAIGRLTRQKGFDLLLRAFAACHAGRLEWRLVILGEGEERRGLERDARQLGIASAVSLPGYVPATPSLLRRGDVFVLSSRYEGFPNALLDAMKSGLPVVATDCPSGPRQIIRNGIDGMLVEPDQVDALAAAMRRLMDEPSLRARLASRSIEVCDRFSMSRIIRQWDVVLARCARAA